MCVYAVRYLIKVAFSLDILFARYFKSTYARFRCIVSVIDIKFRETFSCLIAIGLILYRLLSSRSSFNVFPLLFFYLFILLLLFFTFVLLLIFCFCFSSSPFYSSSHASLKLLLLILLLRVIFLPPVYCIILRVNFRMLLLLNISFAFVFLAFVF